MAKKIVLTGGGTAGHVTPNIALLPYLKEKGYEKASLAVQKANYAVRMYEKAGFRIVSQDAEKAIMVCPLTESL